MHKPATLGRDGRPPDADRRTDDATLIARSRAEPEAFAAIFDRHATDIHRYAARRLGPGPAEDVVGETFLVAFRRRDRCPVPGGRDDSGATVVPHATNAVGRAGVAVSRSGMELIFDPQTYQLIGEGGGLTKATPGVGPAGTVIASTAQLKETVVDHLPKIPPPGWTSPGAA
jgi:hypothetical protein